MMSDQQEVSQDNRQATAALSYTPKSGKHRRVSQQNAKFSEFSGGKYAGLESGQLLAEPTEQPFGSLRGWDNSEP